MPKRKRVAYLSCNALLQIHDPNGAYLFHLKRDVQGNVSVWWDPSWRPERPQPVPEQPIPLYPWLEGDPWAWCNDCRSYHAANNPTCRRFQKEAPC